MVDYYLGLTKDADDAPSWYYLVRIYEAILSITFDLTREQGVNPLRKESIRIFKSDREKHITENYVNMQKPGILITYRECRDIAGGTNQQDDVIYQYQIFLLDRDYDTTYKGMRTWQKWQYQIMNKLRYAHLNDELQISGVSDAPLVVIAGFEALNDVKWDTDNLVRAGIVVSIKAREVRHG